MSISNKQSELNKGRSTISAMSHNEQDQERAQHSQSTSMKPSEPHNLNPSLQELNPDTSADKLTSSLSSAVGQLQHENMHQQQHHQSTSSTPLSATTSLKNQINAPKKIQECEEKKANEEVQLRQGMTNKIAKKISQYDDDEDAYHAAQDKNI